MSGSPARDFKVRAPSTGTFASVLLAMSFVVMASPVAAVASDSRRASEIARVNVVDDESSVQVGVIEQAPGGIRRVVLEPIQMDGVCLKRSYVLEDDTPMSTESFGRAIYRGHITSFIALSVGYSCEKAQFELVSTIDERDAVRLYQWFSREFITDKRAPRNEGERVLAECVSSGGFKGLIGLDRSGAPFPWETRTYFSEAIGCDDAARFVRLVFYDPPGGDVVVEVILAPKGIEAVD